MASLGYISKLQTSLGCAVRPCFRAAASTITTNVKVFSLLPSAILLSFLVATLNHARKCAMVYSNGRRLAYKIQQVLEHWSLEMMIFF